ncbi:hypothetical protein R1flu_025221 [Riccia fluitans]|uniref:Uncharacterized protein n=1 Tax=Riccia fluitans TaxID=41844 RepID=A0ABD1XXJ1_9MARC
MMNDMRNDMKVSVMIVSLEKPIRVGTWPELLLGNVYKRKALHSWQAVSMIACCRAALGVMTEKMEEEEEWASTLGKRMSAEENARADVDEIPATVAPRISPSQIHGAPRKFIQGYVNADHQFLAIFLQIH